MLYTAAAATLVCQFLRTAGLDGSKSSIIVAKSNQTFCEKTSDADIS